MMLNGYPDEGYNGHLQKGGMMTDEQPTQSEPQGSEISDALRELGQNLKEVLRTAWESSERKKVQDEIQSGLTELGESLNKAVNEFSESPKGQTLKADVEDFSQRIRSGEVESKVREEILKVLRLVNIELEKGTKGAVEPEEGDQEPPVSGVA
jgi:hypothetical protein